MIIVTLSGFRREAGVGLTMAPSFLLAATLLPEGSEGRMTMPPHPPHLGAGIYLRKVDEYVLIVIPSHFQREAGVGVTVASSLLFWGGEVYFTTALVKVG